MMEVVWSAPLYTFLGLALREGQPRVILDCGAGGSRPPLALFCQYGFGTQGIEISAEQIERARDFERAHGIVLNIRRGDMRTLPFSDGTFPFVYSYNSAFHLTKPDTAIAVAEMRRVLRPGGLLYINLLSIEDGCYGEGQPLGDGQFVQGDPGETVVHSYYDDSEPDPLFAGTTLVRWEKRRTRWLADPASGHWADGTYLEYVVRTPGEVMGMTP